MFHVTRWRMRMMAALLNIFANAAVN